MAALAASCEVTDVRTQNRALRSPPPLLRLPRCADLLLKMTSKKNVYKIDCSKPAAEDVIHPQELEAFLHANIKVNSKKGNLGDVVVISTDASTSVITVTASSSKDGGISKRYLKYLIKKYLKKQELRDYMRPIATSKDTYTLKYFSIASEGAADSDDEDE